MMDKPPARVDSNNNEDWKGSFVYFGHYSDAPVLYRVLDPIATDFNTPEQTAVGRKTMFLDCNKLLFKKQFSSVNNNIWINSDIRDYLNKDFLNNTNYFKAAEKNAIVESTRTSGARVALSGERVFLLDYEDVLNKGYGYYGASHVYDNSRKKGSVNSWWLRTFYNKEGDGETRVRLVGGSSNGGSPNSFNAANGTDFYVSPAMNIDLSKVLLSTCVSGTLGATNAEYKLTLLDSSFAAGLGTGPLSIKNNVISVPYSISGTNAANVDRLSLLVTNGTWNTTTGWSDNSQIIQYAKLDTGSAKLSSSGRGTFSLDASNVTGVWGKDYHVYLLAEDVYSDNSTDYVSAPVELKGAPVILTEEITVTPKSAEIKVGTTKQLIARVLPDNAGNKTLSWSSSNKNVASVDSKGLVMAKGRGTAVITAKSNDGSGRSATCSITVKNPTMTINTTSLVLQKDKTSKMVKVTVQDDTIKGITKSDSKNVIKSASIDKKTGVLTIKASSKIGNAKIIVKTSGGMSKQLNVKVQKPKVTTTKITGTPASITLSLSNKNKKAKTITAKASPDYYSTKEKISVTGYNKQIVKCDYDKITGKFTFTAKKKGNTNARVKVGKKSKTVKIKVNR